MLMIDEFCGIERLGSTVARVTICNAKKANVLSGAVIDALRKGLRGLADDENLRIVVLTGSGEKTFVGGADIREMSQLTPPSAEKFISKLSELCESVRLFPVPVVARIDGWCLGGGLELAMACDLRIASTRANFAMPEVLVGIPSVIHAALLPRLIGWGRARWMILSGATVDASTALSWGLVDALAEPAELDQKITDCIAPILRSGPKVIKAQKELLRRWENLPLDESIAASIPVFGSAFSTGEPQQHMGHFLNRGAAAGAARS